MTIFIKPRKGWELRDPETGDAIPADGCEVEDGPYWRDWQKCGCLEVEGEVIPDSAGDPGSQDADAYMDCPKCGKQIDRFTKNGNERKRCPLCHKPVGG